MPRIRILPEELANKIAAGEVVERPASVVKELVENSIDAEARSIEVEVRGGGKKLIYVADDGVGMDREDAVLALRRHATSKIATLDDLMAIRTLGFRGEALPSIAAVSKLELITRPPDQMVGTKVVAEGGRIVSVEEVGAPVGTRVRVSNLFFNVPARAKFLKTDQSEFRNVLNVFIWSALAHPSIRFKLIHNSKVVLDLPPSPSLGERIYAIYGRSFYENLIEIREELPNMKLHAFIGNPDFTKPNRSYQLFFLNGRPIRSRLIAAAVDEALSAVIPKERYAVAFIFLEMNPRDVDVNVHPSKMEVRFKDERGVYSQIVRILNKGIHAGLYAPRVRERGKPKAAEPAPAPKGGARTAELPLPGPQIPSPKGRPIETARIERELRLGDLELRNAAIRGVLFDTYILLEREDEVLIVDQHAAAERVIFEKLLKQLESGGIPSQGLILPIPVDLPTELMQVFLENDEFLRRFGFEMERFGGNTVLVRGVPSTLRNDEIEGAVMEVLERLRDGLKILTPSELAREMLATIACRSAVKAGERLSEAEMERLLEELAQTDLPFNCPHSRPTIVRLSKEELESRFRRR